MSVVPVALSPLPERGFPAVPPPFPPVGAGFPAPATWNGLTFCAAADPPIDLVARKFALQPGAVTCAYWEQRLVRSSARR